MAEQKNQHYVPAFYLRLFSIDKKKRLIKLYNVDKGIFIEYANIKNQASKDYYYGKDLEVEKMLSEIEGTFAVTLKKIVDGEIPQVVERNTDPNESTIKLSKEYSSLLFFVANTDLRNPVRKRQADSFTDYLAKKLLSMSKEFRDKMDMVNQFEITHEDNAIRGLLDFPYIAEMMADLDYKLLINQTGIPFITSDNPVVRYNQWMEKRVKRNSGGYGSVGFQTFIPINDKLQILIYDQDIYHVGRPKDIIVNVNRKSDVNQLNLLQYLNSYSNIFGNKRMTETYTAELADMAGGHSRPNGVKFSEMVKADELTSQIFLHTVEGININLNLSFITMTYYAKLFKLTGHLVYLRPYARMVRDKREQNPGRDEDVFVVPKVQ